jgi:large subunit ribosomal protein L9
MKVILIDDVPGTGKKGQALDVKDGYARNFLLPRGLAIGGSQSNTKRFDRIVQDLEKKKERHFKAAEDIKVRLEQAMLTIKKKTGADGKLFGSVTHKDVAEAIEHVLSISIDKRLVRFGETIKMTGAYTVDVHLDEGVHASVKIEVEKEV